MEVVIPDFSKARVLVVGDAMLDRYWYGDATRISPEAPVPVLPIKRTEEKAGGAGNVALNLSSLGVQTAILTITGEDTEATILERLFHERGIHSHIIKSAEIPTITKLRAMSQHQQLLRVDFEETIPEHLAKSLLPIFEQRLDDVDVVILSDYGKGTLRFSKQLIEIANRKKTPIFIDPKSADFNMYHGATIVTPNLKEFYEAVGICKDDDEMYNKAMSLVDRHGFKALLVTRGKDGMSLFQKGEEPILIPTRAREVFDVTGAGDTVIAVMAAAFACDVNMYDAMRLANTAAGISVSKLGAATVTIPELRRELYDLHHGGVMSEDILEIAVADAKAHGEKIVMTNGCFDILHSGHVHYLKQAKKLGDRLIVAVNDDDSVKRLKGETRPINSVDKRMDVLAGLSSVDWVVPFSEDTPKRLICKILPDVLVKGGDWKPEQIEGSACVLANGGEVHSLDYIEGESTTSLVFKISQHSKGESE